MPKIKNAFDAANLMIFKEITKIYNTTFTALQAGGQWFESSTAHLVEIKHLQVSVGA